MTLPLDDRHVQLAPPAGTTVLSWNFRLTRADGLAVFRTRGGAIATLQAGLDYSFPGGLGGDGGGSLTLTAASEAGDVYDLAGMHPEQRLSDFVAQLGFSAAKFNGDLDALTMMAQEHRRDIGRAWKSRLGAAGQAMPAPEAGRIIGWSEAGAIENKLPADAGLVTLRNDPTLGGATPSAAEGATEAAVKAAINTFRVNSQQSGSTVNLSGWDRVIVNRYSNASSLAPALYEARVSDPGHGLSFQDNTGRWFEIAESAIYIEMAGAIGDDATDNHVAIERAFAACDALGVECRAGPGTFLTSDTIGWTLTKNFRFTASPTTVIKATNAIPADAKLLLPSASSEIRFSWLNGKLDGSLMPARVSGAPDLLYVAGPNFKGVAIDGVWFFNNEDRSGTAGDSGLFLSGGEDYRVTNNTFQGAADVGCYISGNSAETTGRKCVVYGNEFVECAVGFISKRSFEDHDIFGNFVEGCNFGISVGGDADTTLLPGKKATITSNVMRSVGCGIQVRVADGTVVMGNRIEDFAVDASGTPVVTAAIRIEGSDDCVVLGNHISSPNVTQATNAAGILLTPVTINSTTYQSEYNLIDTNVIKSANVGIRELSASNFNLIGGGNKYVSCTTPVVKSGARSIVGYEIEGTTPAMYLRDTAGGSDAKLWRLLATANTLTLATRTDADGTGQVVFQAVRSGSTLTQLILTRDMIPNYADDAAASAGGLPIGGLYRTGSAMKIRAA